MLAAAGLDFVVLDPGPAEVVGVPGGLPCVVVARTTVVAAAAVDAGAAGVLRVVPDEAAVAAALELPRATRDGPARLGGLRCAEPPLALVAVREARDVIRTRTGVVRVRLVGSVDEARLAFGAGAAAVVYDLPRMFADLVRSLPAGTGLPGDVAAREPVVLLSGMLGDVSLWDGVAARLADVARPVVCRIDLDDSIAEMASSVLAEAPPSFSLVGHSLGAIVALEVQRQAPDRVRRLALLNASARGPSSAQEQAWAGLRDRVEAGEWAEVASELARSNLPQARRGDTDLKVIGERMAASVGPDGLLRQLRAQAARPESRDRLGEIAVPVLVVSGGLDQVCPPALQQELAAGCPDAQLVTVEDGGHMLPVERPDVLASALRSWLRRGQ